MSLEAKLLLVTNGIVPAFEHWNPPVLSVSTTFELSDTKILIYKEHQRTAL